MALRPPGPSDLVRNGLEDPETSLVVLLEPARSLPALAPLPDGFARTRAGLHTLAFFVIAPARKARAGRIGLRPTGDGFGTPPFDDGTRIVVRGTRLERRPGPGITITTVRAAAVFLGVSLARDPGVGRDVLPLHPDADLGVDVDASFALGQWYEFGQGLLDQLTSQQPWGTVTDAQLWPEHFDLAVVVDLPRGRRANVGVSPGDEFSDDPYVYVGPQGAADLGHPFWNAPFGALLPREQLAAEPDPADRALAFVTERLTRLAR